MSKIPYHWWRAWSKWRRMHGLGQRPEKNGPSGRARHNPSQEPTDAEIQAEYQRRQTGHSHNCKTCTKPLTGKRADQQFCSGKCRNAYYRIRKALKEQRNE